jgi:Tol biopolymer transport system component
METCFMIRRRYAACLSAVLAFCFATGLAAGQTVERVSVNSGEIQGNVRSYSTSTSDDGRFVAFVSEATNLVEGDTNGASDVFLRDRLNGTTERISVADNEAEANYGSFLPSISSDGRFVAFLSDATNLVSGDTNNFIDVFVRDRLAKTTQRISVSSSGVQANDESGRASIGADGRFVVFDSVATNLVASDLNLVSDVFLWDRLTRTVARVSLANNGIEGNGNSERPSVSADGRFVAFESVANNFAAGDYNNNYDVFVHDRLNGATQLISRAMGGGAGNFYAADASITPDGRFVAFIARANNLVIGDTNEETDIFVRDRQTGVTERVNVSIDGAQSEYGFSFGPSISANGRFVAFESNAPNLVGYNSNGVNHAFVRDRLLGTTERATINNSGVGLSGLQGDISLSANGRFVAFTATSTGYVSGDTNGVSDVFLRDRGPRPGVENDVLLDLGNEGVWQWLNNNAQRRLTISNPVAIASGNLDRDPKDEVIASIPTTGLIAYRNNVAFWDERLHASTPSQLAAGDFNGNGRDEIATDFDAKGLWVRYDNATWARVHTYSPDAITTADLDGNTRNELVAVFAGFGLWARYNDTNWVRLHSQSPIRIVRADLDGNGKDEVIADFGGTGLWARYDNGTWTKLHNTASQALAAGDLNGNGKDEVLVSFSGAGLWARYDNGTWARLHTSTPLHVATVDANNNGKDDAVVGFSNSVWVRYDSGNWQLLRASSTEALVAGGFD